MFAAAPDLKDACNRLGLEAGATAATARAAFRAAAKASHPDAPGGDAIKFRETMAAWEQVRAALAAPCTPPRNPIFDLTPMQALWGGSVQFNGAAVTVPAGLRTGDTLRLGEADIEADIIVRGADGLSVLGDDLIMEWTVEAARLETGGRVEVETHVGRRAVWIAPGQAVAALPGLGLPAFGGRAEGRLVVRLKAAETAPLEGRDRLDRFARDWTSDRRAA